MAKLKNLSPKLRALAIAIAVVCLGALGAVIYAAIGVEKIASEDDYTYENPDETKAQPDEGMTIDGVLDEEAYKNNTWLYLHNESGGAPVDIAMTSWYGEKGMYFVYDVTEETPIYVNLDRASYLNSGIEMYLAPSYVSSLQDNSVFEIDMLPTGDMVFKKSNGKGGYTKVTSTNDKTAYLGATTKGGEVNTEECTGYCLELFIPWEYMEWLDMDVATMKESFAYVNPAHITSYNETGTDTSVDRFWYFFVQQKGASFGSVASYFRFDETGALDTVPVTLVEGDHYTISGPKTVIPGMEINVKIKAEDGYALNSILINNEEYIKKVSFNEDGTVVLTLKGIKDGLTISATTEAVTEGNKTLSGVINVNNYGGDNQKGLSASYKGPNGERPIEFDSKGSFVLTDLKQGYYEIIVEKEGYEKVVRGIYLNRDFETIIDLEYPYFETISGTAWGLEEQNKGILIKNPGSGVILSIDSFNKFTVEANFMYDAKLAEESEDNNYFQQRSGFRIEFSNGKYWHINLMNEGGTFKVQYAKHTKENSIFGWKTVHNLTEDEIKKYQSKEGIKLSVLRDGKYANVYLDGKLIAVEVLAEEFESATARIGFEGWVANPEAVEIPFSISRNVNVDLRNAFFTKAGGFDISGQYNNVLALTDGGRANIDFAQKYVNMDLRLTVQDYADPEDTAARNDVLFVFPNGAHVSFGICKDGDVYRIQSLNRNANDGQQIYNRYKSHGVLTVEEAQKYTNGGVEFRIARVGTEVTLYVDNRMVAVCDLTNNNSGVKATDEATVTIRHYDDAGVKVEMPFAMTDKMSIIAVDHKEDKLGVTKGEKQNYLVGDTVVLSGEGKDGYYCTSMKVNGVEVPLNWDGTYTFTAEDKDYVIESTYDEAVFKDNNNWGLLEQNQGVITRPESQKEAWLDFYEKKADFDITLKVKGIDDTSATAIRFSFNEEVENTRTRTGGVKTEVNEWATFRIVKDQGKEWKLMSMGTDSVFEKWLTFYTLTEEEVQKYLTEGIDFRVARVGTEVYLFLDGKSVCEPIDISKDKDGNPTGITEDMKATVSVRHYGTITEDVKILFEATEELDYIALKDSSTNGKVVIDGVGLVGAQVTVKGQPADGYYLSSLKVDGKEVTLNWDGTYTFTATKKNYTVEGTFDKAVFVENDGWNLLEQKDGVVSLPITHGNSSYLEFIETYADMHLTLNVRDYIADGSTGFSYAVKLHFDEVEKDVIFRLTYDSGIFGIQSMGGTYNYKWFYQPMTTEEVEALQSEDGIDFEVVRYGSNVYFYLDDKRVGNGVDLTVGKDGNATGVTADMEAIVSIKSDGNKGHDVEIPFTIIDEPPLVTITDNSTNGAIINVGGIALVGDEVTIKGKGDGYFLKSLKVDGQNVTLNWDGTYTFTATKTNYTVEGTFVEAVFVDNDGWNLLEQDENKISLPADRTNNNSTYLEFIEKYTDMNLTLFDVKDYDAESDADYGYVVKLHFADVDKNIIYRLTSNTNDGNITIGIQSMGGANGWGWPYGAMTEVELEALENDGIDFQVIRFGTKLYFYLNGNKVGNTIDLSTHGITVDMEAAVSVRADGNMGNEVVIPFTITDELPVVTITDKSVANGSVEIPSEILVGETVTIKGKAANGYFCKSLSVDGQSVDMNTDGTYIFVATKDSYEVEGTFVKAVFVDNAGWNLLEQDNGIISLPNGGNGGALEFYEKYTSMDLTVTAKDYADANTTNPRTDILFVFENGAHLSVGITTDGTNAWIQSLNKSADDNKQIYNRWKAHGELNAEEYAEFIDGGVEFRVVRADTYLHLYIGDRKVNVLDLTNNESGVTATTEATVYIRHYDDAGVEVEIPFEISTTVPGSVSISLPEKVTAQFMSYFLNEEVILTVDESDGKYYTSLTVDGADASFTHDGTYTFTATKNSYDVAANFKESVFATDQLNYWYLTNQHKGIVVQRDDYTDRTNTLALNFEGYFGNVDVSIIVKAGEDDFNADGSLKDTNGDRTAIGFYTVEDGNVGFSILLQNGKYYIGHAATKNQETGKNMYDNSIHEFTAEETELIKTEGIELRVVRVGKEAHIYLGGNYITTYTMQYAADQDTALWIRRWDDTGVLCPIEYKVPVVLPDFNITSDENGSVNVDASNYSTDKSVVVKVEGNDGYYYDSLTINGEDITVNNDGTYTITNATEDTYTISAAFKASIFKENQLKYWYLTNQHKGIVVQRDDYTGTNKAEALDFVGSFGNVDVSIIVKAGEDDFNADGTLKDSDGDRTAIGFYNAQDGNVGFSVLLQNGKYYIGHAATKNQETGKNMYDNSIHEFTAKETELIKTEGIELRVVRIGKEAHLYLDGSWIYTYTMQYDADEETGLWIRRWDDTGVLCPIEYKISEEVPTFDIADVENGAISIDTSTWALDNKVTFTVTPETNYNRTGFVVKNGNEEVHQSTDVKYGETKVVIDTVADGAYTVEATFAGKVFVDSTVWDLSKQYAINGIYQGSMIRGIGANNTTYLELLKKYTDISFTSFVKMGSGNSYIVRLFFTEAEAGIDKNIIFQIYNDGGNWILKTWGDSYGVSGKVYYDISSDLEAKITGAGLKFEVVRVGTKAYVYMDDQRVCDAINLTGLTANTETTVKVRLDGAVDSAIEIPFAVSTEVVDRGEVYVASTGTNGVHYGTESAPVQTLEYALSMVDNGGTIFVQDAIDVPSNVLQAAVAKSVTIAGVDTSSALNFTATGDIDLKTAMTFTNVKMTFAAKAKIFAWGNRLEIAEDVTGIDKTGSDALGIYAGGRKTAVDSTEVVLKAGTYRIVYGGGWRGAVNGDTHVTISHNANTDTNIDYTNHDATYCVYGGAEDADVTGNTYVTIGDVTIGSQNACRFNYVYGGGRNTSLTDVGRVIGDCHVDFYGYSMSVFGGTEGHVTPTMPYVVGNTYVTMHGGYVQQIFGGCQDGSMEGNTNIIVEAGQVYRRIYGGCYNEDVDATHSVTGHTNVTIIDGVTLSYGYTLGDNSLYAISRVAVLAKNEWGTFIFNENSSYISKLGAQGWIKPGTVSQSYHYKVLTNGNKADGSLGTVVSENDKLHITPADGYVAKVTVDGVDSYYDESYYALPELSAKTDTKDITVTFVEKSTVEGSFIAVVNGAYFDNAQMAVTEANKDGAVVEILDSSKVGKLTIDVCDNGAVTTTTPYYVVGDDVTLTVKGEGNYYYTSLKIDGVEVEKIANDGTYKFTTSETENEGHKVVATFADRILDTANSKYWYFTNQHKGWLVQRDDYSDRKNAPAVNFMGTHVDCDVSITIKAGEDDFNEDGALKDKAGVGNTQNNAGDRTAIGFYNKAKDVNVAFSIILDTDGKYYVAHAGTVNGYKNDGSKNSLYGGKANYIYAFSDDETTKIKNEGVTLRVVRIQDMVNVYLDGKFVGDYSLSQDAIPDELEIGTAETNVWLRRWDDTGTEVPIQFTFKTESQDTANVEVDIDIVNGSVTTSQNMYFLGETVKLTVTPDADYNRTNLVVKHNGEVYKSYPDVVLGAETIEFVVEEAGTYVVEAEFTKEIFEDHDKLDLTGQYTTNGEYQGVISSTNAGKTGYTQTLGSFDKATFLIKDEDEVDKSYAFDVQYVFETGEILDIQVLEWNNIYRVKTIGSGTLCGDNKEFVRLDATKVKGDGVKLEIVRAGMWVMLYVDGVRVDSFRDASLYDFANIYAKSAINLSKDYNGNNTGITKETKATIKLQCGGGGISVSSMQVSFALSNDVPDLSVVDIASTTNGTITSDKVVYEKGETVTLTVAGADGYYYDSLKVNGVEVNANGVVVDNNGNHSFEATEDVYEVTGSFAASLFKESTKNHWYLMNQHFGVITQNGNTVTGSTDNLDFNVSCTYSDFSIKVKAGEDDFNEDGSLKDVNGNRIAIRYYGSTNYGYSIILDPSDGKYYVRACGTQNTYTKNYYVLNEEENQKIKTGDGIIFRVVQLNGHIYIYLDNKLVYDEDFYFGTDAVTPVIRNYDDGGLTIPMEYSFTTADASTGVIPEATFTNAVNNKVISFENGTITLDKDSYVLGEPVTLTVAGETDYYYDSLIINGKSVMVNDDGTYTFAADEVNTISASFAPSIFKSVVTGWNLTNQHMGKIIVTYQNASGNSNWADFVDTYQNMDLTLVAREYEDTTKPTLTRSAVRLMANNKIITFSIAKNTGNKYSIQALSGDNMCNPSKDFYIMKDEEIAKFNSEEGIEFRVVLKNSTNVDIYLDGVKVVDNYDLTKYDGEADGADTGITSNTEYNVTMRRYDDPGITAEYGFYLSTEIPQTASIEDTPSTFSFMNLLASCFSFLSLLSMGLFKF